MIKIVKVDGNGLMVIHLVISIGEVANQMVTVIVVKYVHLTIGMIIGMIYVALMDIIKHFYVIENLLFIKMAIMWY